MSDKSVSDRRQSGSSTFLLVVVLIYAGARLIGLNLLLIVERQLRGVRDLGGQPPFRLWHDALYRWDVYFYDVIAREGYPASVPVDAAGNVLASQWAFFPLFPVTAAAVDLATGFGFVLSAIIVNVIAGAGTAVLIARVVRDCCGDDRTALRAVALWCFFPSAFVLQVPYAEALFVLLAAGCLATLLSRRHLAASVLLILASLTRGAVLPLSAAVVAVVVRDLVARRGTWRLLPLATAAAVGPILWPTVAAIVTGRADAYAATQGAWGYAPEIGSMFTRWRDAWNAIGWRLLVDPPVIALGAAAFTALGAVRMRLAAPVTIYAIASVALLMALAQPGAVAFGSLPRFAFAVLTIPIVLAMWLRHRAVLALVLIASAAAQYWWVYVIWSGYGAVAP